jgi:IEC3 subunit of the Ino80 complex, chromatin re-modelling
MALRDERLAPPNAGFESILTELGGVDPLDTEVGLSRTEYLDKMLARLPVSIIHRQDEAGSPYAIQDVLDDDTIQLTPSNYLDSIYETEYLENLDPQLEDASVFEDVDSHPLRLPPSRILPSDRDLANMNQDSVVSWLKRNHPETFIQGGDKDHAATENGSTKAEKAASKRASIAAKRASTAVKPDPDAVVEEEGSITEPKEKGGKGKKSKEDDQSYRPKGGYSRPKRKREEGDIGTKTPGAPRGKRVKSQASAV